MERGEFVPLDPERFLEALVRTARQLREERSVRLRECPQRWKVGLPTLRDWEKQTYTPSLISLIKLANGLEIDFRELVDRAVRLCREQG
jgi:transcriptional regulator with XRE-family HTH domain